MTGDPKVIAALMTAASMETAICTQYSLDQRDLEFQGLKHLSSRLRCFAKASRNYRAEITDRIFYLGGTPAYEGSPASTAASVTQLLQRALASETAIVDFYNKSAIDAMEARDDNTRNKFEHWIKWHEDNHIDWIARQLAQIGSMTEAEYVKVQLSRS